MMLNDDDMIYAWQGYLHQFPTHQRVRGLTRKEETFLVNEGSPTRITAGPAQGSTVRVTNVLSLKFFHEAQ